MGTIQGIMAGIATATALVFAAPLLAAPTVFPTGTTIYQPDAAYSGFTVLSPLDTKAVIVIDMNGRVVKRWNDFDTSAGGPARVLPGGIVIAPEGENPGFQEALALVARRFDGTQLWRHEVGDEISTGADRRPSSRQHHDWQLSSFPAGYFSPDFTPDPKGPKRLLLTHTAARNAQIADVELKDDRLVELDTSGKVVWEWRASDHIEEFGFTPAARTGIRLGGTKNAYDWIHLNSATYVGPNPWFDAGDKRFDPENIIISSRQASFVAIVDRKGSIVWRLGPDFSDSPLQQAIGQIIGQHHAHLIPPGLPGAGNMLIFDNGGTSGYGTPSPIAPNGQGVYARATSRVVEIDPVSLKVVWSYTAPTFYSSHISGAQRLANGNTLVTEGSTGRIFELTPEKDIVWEYMGPPGEGARANNAIYRAYRLPYSWIPQLGRPAETAIEPPAPGTFHVPGTPAG